MIARDDAFVTAVVSAADAAARALLTGSGVVPLSAAPLGPHREAMRRVKLLVAVHTADDSELSSDSGVLALALDYARTLHRLQTPSGLFGGGDNVESPPDSGFTINDLGDAIELLRRAPEPRHPELSTLEQLLFSIAVAAAPAMLFGGVHTPNHRWELAAALARLHRIDGSPAIRERILDWLGEGIDIDLDGQYSERSANYAAYVSNPSLLAIGDIMGRADLHDLVVRNLESTLDLVHADATVETVHSRRQDQKDSRFPLAPFAMHYRRFAIAQGRGDFAWAAQQAVRDGVAEPHTALAELLLEPELGGPLPEAIAPRGDRRRTWQASALVRDDSPARTLVVYGGSDYPAAGRIRSGLANNPTFLRMFAGEIVLDSVRLSRDFFGLGPFRASSLQHEGDSVVLTESIDGRYYQPLAPDRRRPGGDYRVVDEGRFAAAMSFDERDSDAVTLETRIVATPLPDGVELEITTHGPAMSWSLELAFRPGGRFEGDGSALVDGEVIAVRNGVARYRVGEDAVEFGPGPDTVAPAGYRAGEDYDYLGGTDALNGPRAYISGRGPGAHRISIRRVRA